MSGVVAVAVRPGGRLRIRIPLQTAMGATGRGTNAPPVRADPQRVAQRRRRPLRALEAFADAAAGSRSGPRR